MTTEQRYSNNWLTARCQRGERPKFLFFWGHRPSPDGRVTKSCFSQWWPAAFDDSGRRYATAEHWMMAGKARLFGDGVMLDRILETGSPAAAKKLGREVRGFDAARWDAHKYALVVTGNRLKFAQHPDLGAFLRGTGDRVLVEASPVDRIWGIGMKDDHPQIENPLQWRGENLLGYALMEVRDLLGSPEAGGASH